MISSILRSYIFLPLVLTFFTSSVMAQTMWDKAHIEDVRNNLSLPYYAAAYDKLLRQADSLIDVAPMSVMQKKEAPASGDKHDYMSLARYFWPDPQRPDGLPYINRDGQSNPELKQFDREPLGKTASRIVTLSLAYYFSGKEQYAKKATELIRVWFLNKETKMNPHLRYAQVIKGKNNNMGRCIGVIDTYSFVEMVQALPLLEGSKSFTKNDSKQLKNWFRQLTKWILTDPEGKKESDMANNHSIAYDAQVIAFSLYCGDNATALQCVKDFPEKRLFKQIKADGSMPHELRRTLAMHYSWYNLTHIIDICFMAKTLGVDIYAMKSDDGISVSKAIDFLAPYVGKDAKPWPYQQINDIETVKQNIYRDMYRAYAYFDCSRQDYNVTYQLYRVLKPSDRFNLIYYIPDATDHNMAWCQTQMRYAIECVKKAKNDKANTIDRKVNPRTITKDGKLALVNHKDWCTGFFPGELWQMYRYTNDEFWRKNALSQTWAIEDLKYHGGTHDLGFMAGLSFGLGYQFTGEQSLRDVMIDASKTLIKRFNPTVGCIRSWDHNKDEWGYPVIIDNMMNLEMLFKATQLTGDSIYWNVAVSHANTTMKNHFRPDASTYHVVDYDPATGAAVKHQTHQGYSDESYWSRGQGWALYGYTMCYRFTHDVKYLEQAKRVAEFWLSLPNMPADKVPYWDMKDPAIANNTAGMDNPDVPRDASAAALIASALYELATYVPGQHDRYRGAADGIMDSLDKYYHASTKGDYGFLLLHSTGHKPHNSEVDVPLSYADYYYVEAQLRRKGL